MRIGLYPGTFDPITLGHADIIKRAMILVDRLVIGVAINRDKGPLFTLEERVAMVEDECRAIAQATGGEIVVHPFEMNRAMDDSVETVFLMADARRQAIASKLVKEIARLGGDTSKFVTPAVNRALTARFVR